MKISIVAFSVFFPVLINTVQGGLSIEPTYRGVAATFGLSWLETSRKVTFPATLPYIFAGLRISLSLALVVAVVGEMLAGGSGAGIGLYIVGMEYAGRAAEMYVAIFLLGLCGYLINRAFLISSGSSSIGMLRNQTIDTPSRRLFTARGCGPSSWNVCSKSPSDSSRSAVSPT